MSLDTRQHAIRNDSIRAYVLVGGRTYPMQPTFMLSNRWETLVPISGDREYVNYQYKVNYDYNCIPHPNPGSKLSEPFHLQILDNR
jgi:hypothetical protein